MHNKRIRKNWRRIMDKMDMQTPNMADEKLKKLIEIFPNIVTETIDEDGNVVRAIDKDILEQEISSKVVEGREERYQFTWPDKKQAILAANAPISKTLRPCREESKNFDTTENLYIEGDNLEVLKLLQETYLGKIKMIYIDPPYNTGKDFVYNDDFKQTTDEYLEDSGQFDDEGNRLEKNLESNGRFHTDWLNMIYPRLKLARNLLSDDGVILISIDDNEQSNLKKVCDEIFGETNFIVDLKWANKEGGGSSDSRHFRVKDEHILIYGKLKTLVSIKGLPVSDVDRYRGKDKYLETRGPFQLIKLDSASIQYSESLDYYILMPDGQRIKASTDKQRKSWRWSKEKFEWGLENGYVEIKKDRNNNWTVYTKQYLNADNEGNKINRNIQPMGIIDEFSTTQANKYLKKLLGNSMFSYSKPMELVKFLCERIIGKEDIILDFFSGSATTAHAVMQLNAEDGGNRKFIMVQLPEQTDEKSEAYKAGYKNICEIGKERIRRAGEKILEENKDKENIDKLDVGFRVLKTDTSNMKDVYYTPENTEQSFLDSLEDNIKEDRTQEDLLFQVMLDLGVPLSSTIEVEQIEDAKVFKVEDRFLVACFDGAISDEVVRQIADMKPFYAVFRDVSMKNDSVAVNFEQIFESVSPETIRKVL